MKFLKNITHRRFFWVLLLLGSGLAMGQMPFDLPFVAFLSLSFLGGFWIKYNPLDFDSFVWGLGYGIGYFTITFFWIVEPFLVTPVKTGWIAPFALFGLVLSLSVILATSFFLAAKLGVGGTKNKRLFTLFLFFLLSELIRSELLIDFPWGLISSMWINTPISQTVSLVGPYWLSGLTILSAFLIARPWIGSVLGLSIIIGLYSFGHVRLTVPLLESLEPITIRIVQPNIKQSEKWKPDLAAKFLNQYIEMSSNARETGVDLIVWPETAVSYSIQKENKLRSFISDELGVYLVLGARRFEEDEKKLFNSAFMLGKNGDILRTYDKIRLVPFGEYIPMGRFLSFINLFGLATDGLTGFSSGESQVLFETNKLGKFKILICYEAIFPTDISKSEIRPSWMINITNDAWFGTFSGPQQHLALARMRAIEQGIPMVRSANTGISAIIGPYGRIHSQLNLGETSYLDGVLPLVLEPTLYSHIGERFINILLNALLMLTIAVLILIKLSRKKEVY